MAATEVTVQMQQRRDTAAGWTSANPVLLNGELGYETNTGKFKIGNGSSAWNALSYIPAFAISAHPLATADIANDAITADKLAHTSVTAGSYTAADITVDAQGRITSAASGTISTAEIANDAVTAAKLADTAVTAGSYTAADITVDAQGRITAASSGSVGTAEIADGSITTAKLANGAVTNAKLSALSVETGKIQDDAVTTDKIQDDAVTGDKLANDVTIANDLTVTNNLTINGTRINSSGNVGIGTTGPASKLHLHQASGDGFDGLRFTNTVTGTTATDGFVIGLNDSEDGKIWNYDNNSIQFGVDNELHGTLRQDGRWCLGPDQTSGSTTLNVFSSSGASASFRADSDPGIEIKDESNSSIVEIMHNSAQMVVDLDLTNQVTGESLVIKTNGTSANDQTLLRIDSDGLKFGSDTAAANALDDYEQGSWTPTYVGGTSNPTLTYDQQNGTYTKIGRTVTCHGRMRTDSKTGGSGNLSISGLPFTVANDHGQRGTLNVGFAGGFAGETPAGGLPLQNNAVVRLYAAGASHTADYVGMDVSDLGATTNDNNIYFTIMYTTAQ